MVIQKRSRSEFSLIGIRFQKRFANMAIPFKGTVIDLRKAAATLTVMHYPSLQELMSRFICQTSKVQRKHYQVSMGHYGLAKAFNALGKMQSYPFVKNIDTISSNHSSKSQILVLCSHVTQSYIDAPHHSVVILFVQDPKYLSPLKMKHFSIQLNHFYIVKPFREVTKPISKHSLCV